MINYLTALNISLSLSFVKIPSFIMNMKTCMACVQVSLRGKETRKFAERRRTKVIERRFVHWQHITKNIEEEAANSGCGNEKRIPRIPRIGGGMHLRDKVWRARRRKERLFSARRSVRVSHLNWNRKKRRGWLNTWRVKKIRGKWNGEGKKITIRAKEGARKKELIRTILSSSFVDFFFFSFLQFLWQTIPACLPSLCFHRAQLSWLAVGSD